MGEPSPPFDGLAARPAVSAWPALLGALPPAGLRAPTPAARVVASHCRPVLCAAVLRPRSYKLNVWDVGGQKTLRSYWRNYYEETDGVIWVVDSADRRRLRDCKEEFGKLLGQEKLAGATLLVLANKQDISGALSMDDIATALELGGESTAKRHWKIEPCSAVTGDGLEASVDWLVRDISSRIFLGD